MTPEQDPTKDTKASDALSTDVPTTSETESPKTTLPPMSGDKKTEEPSPRPEVKPVDINLPIVAPKKSNFKLVAIIVAVIVLLVAVGYGIYSILSMSANPTGTGSTNNTANSNTQLKAVVTIMDGKAMYSKDGEAWLDLKADITLGQGDFVQTQTDSLVMLTLDDGSVIRMNAATIIELEQLSPNNIIVNNLAGDVYTRVAKSDNRTFSVNVDEMAYTALGTAYKTTNTVDEKGVQVYESAVEAGKDGVKVEEGKQFFEKHEDAKKEKKVTTVPIDELTSDEFILWNLEQDKKDKEHKEHLGYLEKVQQERDANKEEGDKPTPKPSTGGSNDEGDPGSTRAITLSGYTYNDKGAFLSWTTSGVSGHDGFKVVRSKDDSTPTYGQNEAQFVGADTREYKWSDGSGKTFYYRVCVYRAGNCSNYSNTIQVKSPYVAPPEVVSGPVNLSNTGSTINWTFGGTAPYGFKIVADSSDNTPTYPEHYVTYVDKNTSSFNLTNKLDDGTYYVRVCKYKNNGTCMDYSNAVQVTIP